MCLFRPASTTTSAKPTSTVASSSSSHTTTSTSSAPSSTVTPASGNPWTGYQVWSLGGVATPVLTDPCIQTFLSPYYVAEVNAAVANITDATLAAQAAQVASIPNFTWLDQVAKVPTLGTYLQQADALAKSSGQKQLLQIVIYDLPDRDCAAKASNGEFTIADNGQANYFNYIDQIVAQIKGLSLLA